MSLAGIIGPGDNSSAAMRYNPARKVDMDKIGQTAAFIDLDGTLYDGYIWQAITRHHLQHRMKLLILTAYLGLHLPLWPLLKLKIISADTFYELWGSHMAWLIRGVSIKRAEQLWVWLIEQEIVPALRPEMEAAIQAHKREGHQVILLSGTFQPLLDALARRIGVHGAIATPLLFEGDHYCGRIQPPLNIGFGKLARINQYLLQKNGEIDLSSSYLYTDSIVDLPVLNAVGNPVAVYPDRDLANLARLKSWKIISN
jgi:phosphoserine phosphatase